MDKPARNCLRGSRTQPRSRLETAVRSGGERTPGRLAFKTEKLEKQRRAWGKKTREESSPRKEWSKSRRHREVRKERSGFSAGTLVMGRWGRRPVLWVEESVKVRLRDGT